MRLLPAKIAVGGSGRASKLRVGLFAVLAVERSGAQVGRVDGQAGILVGAAIALQPVFAGDQLHLAQDQTDAPMAQADQVLRHLVGAAEVIGHCGIQQIAGVLPVDLHDGQSAAHQLLDKGAMGAARGVRVQDAVDAFLLEDLQVVQIDQGILIVHTQDRLVVVCAQFGGHGLSDCGVIRVGNIRDDETDEV